MANRIEEGQTSRESEFSPEWVRTLIETNRDNFLTALNQSPEFNTALFNRFKGGLVDGGSSVNFSKNSSQYEVSMDSTEHELGMFELSEEYQDNGRAILETIEIGAYDYVDPYVYSYTRFIGDDITEVHNRTATADIKIKEVLSRLQRKS